MSSWIEKSVEVPSEVGSVSRGDDSLASCRMLWKSPEIRGKLKLSDAGERILELSNLELSKLEKKTDTSSKLRGPRVRKRFADMEMLTVNVVDL